MKRRTAIKNIAALGASIGIMPSVLGSPNEDKWVLMSRNDKIGEFVSGEPVIYNHTTWEDADRGEKRYADGAKWWTFDGEIRIGKIQPLHDHFLSGGSLFLKKGKRGGGCFMTDIITIENTYKITLEGIGALA